jgi:lambda family phage minor tail protein L
MTIENEVRQGWHDAIVEMFELDLSTISEEFSDKYYFTNETMPDGSYVQWKGQAYTAFPIDAGGFDISTKGQMPQPEITVANILGTFSSAISAADDLVGAKVTRRRTLFKYLDNGTSPDQTQEFPEDIFYIERKTSETNLTVTWQLASKIDLEGLLLPRRIITQDHCLWRYKGAECGYDGPPVSDEYDQPLSGASAEGKAYSDALQALRRANARLASAQAEYNNAKAAQEESCSALILQRSEARFNLRRSVASGQYTFAIKENTQYFAAYNDNQLIPAENFERSSFFGQQREGDAIFGNPQNTGRGPTNNGTGQIWGVNRWIGVASGETVDGVPPTVVAQLSSENGYNPPQTFAMLDLDGNVLIASNGEIKSADETSDTSPGSVPFIGTVDQVKFTRGPLRETNLSPVVDLQIWERSSSLCDNATERLGAAEVELGEAEEAQATAQAAFDVALAALPVNDELRNLDRCGKRLTSCRLRFGTSTLPFGGFPGANLFR